MIDVSGGSFDGLSGGTVLIRAPIIGNDPNAAKNGSVNVGIASSASFRGARSVTLEAYAVWSATDDATVTGLAKHFDGIVDPAGWYDSSGKLLPGSFADASGNTIANWDGVGSLTATQLAADLAQYYFAPNAPNAAHQTFYGWTNGDNTDANSPGTLMGFIDNPGLQNLPSGIANLQVRPGVDLANPSNGPNGGNILVLSNWNLGALDAGGKPVFRDNGIAPAITLRAGGSLKINASITDGFVLAGAGSSLRRRFRATTKPTRASRSLTPTIVVDGCCRRSTQAV